MEIAGMTERKGQWIILSGLILALGLLSLVILLNQAMSAGYKVSAAETGFGSREITEIYEETVRTAKLVWDETQDNAEFNANMHHFSENISRIYATHGVLVDINVTKQSSGGDIAIANLTMEYYDGKVNFSLLDRKIQL
ncbi:MAG: hypothetical protein ACXQTW_08695 [Candidatus Methanospirareceae archaeon]